MSKQRIAIIGAGGFARETRHVAQECGYAFAGYVVSDPANLGPNDSKQSVRGDLAWLLEHRGELDALALGIGAPGPRVEIPRQLADDFGPEYWPKLIHPSVQFDSGSCTFGCGVVMLAGTSMSVNVQMRDYAMSHLGCTVGHESIVGTGSTLYPGANVAGGVEVGAGVLVGTGAQILQYRSVGDGAVIGAGAVVTKDVAPGITVVGVPARPKSAPP